MVTEAMYLADVAWDFLEDINDLRLNEERKPGDDVIEQKGGRYQNGDGQRGPITLRGQE